MPVDVSYGRLGAHGSCGLRDPAVNSTIHNSSAIVKFTQLLYSPSV